MSFKGYSVQLLGQERQSKACLISEPKIQDCNKDVYIAYLDLEDANSPRIVSRVYARTLRPGETSTRERLRTGSVSIKHEGTVELI